MTAQCIYIHQLLVSGWSTLCLQSYLNVSWHRFNRGLEPHLRDSSPCRHDIITQLLHICWLRIPKVLYWIEVWFEIMFKKPLRAESLPRKYSPPHYTSSLKHLYKAGWSHAFILFTANCDVTAEIKIHQTRQHLSNLQLNLCEL